MSNYFPDPNIPNLLNAPGFDAALVRFKNFVLDYITNNAPEQLSNITKALDDDAGMFAKLVQACCYIANLKIQQANTKALQNFASFAKSDMLDAKVADLGLKRQVIQVADLTANPPIPEILESDESLLTRFYLASYALKPGSRKGYEFHARTVGDKPLILVDQTIPGEINVKYKFDVNSNANKVRDAACRRVNPGEVDVHILTHTGVADVALIQAVHDYLHREDIKEETDTVNVKAASLVDYQIHVKVTNTLNQNPDFIKEQLELEYAEFIDKQRKLNGVVRPEQVGGVIWSKDLTDYEVLKPVAAIAASANTAPNCTGVIVEVI